MRTKLPEQIVLKVDTVSWNVNLEKGKDDVVLLGDGWKEFVNAYSLKKEDVLVFKYNRQECFEVFLFDGANLCEKEASYFVRKGHQEKNSRLQGDKEEENVRSKGHTNTPRRRSGNNPVGTPKRFYGLNACTRDSFDDQDELADNTSDEKNSSSKEVITTPREAAVVIRERDSSAFSATRKRKHNDVKISTPKKNRAYYALRYKSNRRPVTDQEIKNAFIKAKKEASLLSNNKSVVAMMRPSGVYKRFFMTIPTEWKPAKVFKKGQDAILRMADKTWVCRVSFCGNRVGIEGEGWKNFASDNFLEEYDVCMFVLSGSYDGRHVLDVSIFRVVQEVVPPTLI